MKAKYDDIEIDVSDVQHGLINYAKAVLFRMQKSDPEFAGCWTACIIDFNGLNPDFTWGSIEDLIDTKCNNNIYVELKI